MTERREAAVQQPEIGDYGIIGDCRSGALVSREGSIDWYRDPGDDRMVANLVNGLLFAFGYALVFETLGRAGWWIGLLLGGVHSAGILVFMPFIAGVHPRMATEQDGLGARRALQPPGFFALNYGRRTPLFGLLSHLAYGLIMGTSYPVG